MATSRAWPFGRFLLTATVAATCTLAPLPALAQPDAESDAARTAAARALFEEGLGLLDEERWEEAADRFERALAIRHSPQIAYNLTTALVGMGELVRASEVLLSIIRDESAPANVRDAAETRRQEVLPRLGRLTIRVDGEREGATLTLDDGPLEWAMVGVELPVDPGPHEIVATRGEEEVARGEVQVAEGGVEEVSLELPPPVPSPEEVARQQPPPPPTRPEPAADEGGGILSSWWFWTGVTAVVAGGVLAAILIASSGGQADPISGTAGFTEVGE